MLDNFIFEDHHGRRFVGRDNGVYLNYNDLRDYSWNYDIINNKISRFYRAVTDRKIPLIVYCKSDDEAISVKNRLLELSETDIEARLPGKVWINGYYTNGYITASKKSNYLISKRLCYLELTLTSDDPAWYSEKSYVFNDSSGESGSIGDGADYPYDFSYDYGTTFRGRTVVADSGFGDNAFRLKIYGGATNPAVMIGGHTYAINGTIGAGESLLIDSLDKTITLTTSSGGKVNWFDRRSRDEYIFEPIPKGQNTVGWSGNFAFDLTVIEKRSEPKWI
jgi:hypothetical protein